MSRIVEFKSSTEEQIVRRISQRVHAEIDRKFPETNNPKGEFSSMESTAITPPSQNIDFSDIKTEQNEKQGPPTFTIVLVITMFVMTILILLYSEFR